MPQLRTTYSQFHMLVDYMEKHGDISKYKPNPIGKANMLKHWEVLTRLVNRNADGGTGPIRTPDQWRKVWSDFKNNSRKKAAKMRKAENCDEKRALSKLESRVMAIVNSNHLNQPKVHGSNKMVDNNGLLNNGGNGKPKHSLLNSDSEKEESGEDETMNVKVKMDYSIENFTDPANFTRYNEQKDNVSSSLMEIEDQINSNTLIENNDQQNYYEASNEAQNSGQVKIITSDFLQQKEQKSNILNSWINSIQYKRQKNSSASGWVESDVSRSNETVFKQKNPENVLNNGRINYGMNMSLNNVDKKSGDNSIKNEELNNNSIRRTVVNIRANSSSLDIKQLNYGVTLWSPNDVEKFHGKDNSTQNKEKIKGAGILVENNSANCLVPKGKIKYGIDILTSTRLQNDGMVTTVENNNANSNAVKNIDTYIAVERNSQANNCASSSTQSNEQSTEAIADKVDNHNSDQSYSSNTAKRRKSRQMTQSALNKRIKIGERDSLFIDEDREQRKHEQELELMRLEIQKEDLKLRTRRLTLIERIVTMAQEYL